ncbi:MAG: hypothetical protein HQL67_07650 [Magnetococcales bacterium]|nr:hypothetical protein [Magnetococcales bacterium]
MLECADLTQLKLDLLKGMPRVYHKLIARLNQEGLVEEDIFDADKRRQMDGILDYYYRKFMSA